MTKTARKPRKVRGWTNDPHPSATCPSCGTEDALTRQSPDDFAAVCSNCGLAGQVVWRPDGSDSAYMIVSQKDPGSPYLATAWAAEAEGRYTVFDVRPGGDAWTIAGWRPELIDDCEDHAPLPRYVMDAVHSAWGEDKLREILRPGMTVYTMLTHRRRSGMTRSIGARVIVDGAPVPIDHFIAAALGWPFDRMHGGVKVSGCGMDMGFHLVHTLSAELYPGENGGYALHHIWL